MTLLELQRRMAEDVRRPLTTDNEMRHTTDDGASVEAIAASYIRPNDRLSSFVRIPVMWAPDYGDVGRTSERSDAGCFLQ
ncbi:MAG TPA: hypothetical protein VKR57_06320 [Terriglobales bacterium]|nr:hypothetical protein [Terriglobales bacterium]